MDLHSFVVTALLGVLICGINGEMERERELERRGWNADIGHSGSNGYHKVGGSIGYKKGGWDVRGSGWVDNRGGYGVGASLSYSWRRGLPMPKDKYYLRFEANRCIFKTYDEDANGVITIEDMHSILPDEKLANSLFEDLDANKDGEVDEEEFEETKGLISGCGEPSDNKKK